MRTRAVRSFMDADMKTNSTNWVAEAAAEIVSCLLEAIVEFLL